MSVDQETLVFRREGVPPSLSLLIPTFAFPYAPEFLTERLQGEMECSPTIGAHAPVKSFGIYLYARLSSTHDTSTSELLRTL